MHNILFWKSWITVYQRLFWGCASVVFFALIALWISNFRSPEPVFSKENFQELEAQEIPIHTFYVGTTALTVKSDNLLVFEHVLGSELRPNQEASYLFLGLLVVGIVVLMSVLTTFSRFWFYGGMGLFLLTVVSLRLEGLELGGMTSRIPTVIVVIAFSAVGYYFQFLRPSDSFIKRLAVFFTLTLITTVGIILLSKIPQPLYYLSANGLIAGTILTVLFIFMIAHEIIAGFITVLTRARKPTRSLQHFLIVSAIYLINLGLIYADRKHIIEWDFFPINLFLLMTVSAILGLWGFRQREPLYESIMKANPFGSFFFLSLAAICFATTGYFIATANDPTIQFLQDVVLYSHLGYGVIFVVYIITNFVSLLGANMAVYKVVYKPATMPYFTFRFAGLIATFAFFAYSNWQVSVNQVYAGYYNALGDFYLAQDTILPAEGYYQRSVYYATRNYHAHYALSELHASRWHFEKEKEELEKLANGRPLDLAYLNYSRIYELEGNWRESMRVLKMGLHDFPKNGLLQNALGLTYANLAIADSAKSWILEARNSSYSKSIAETNLSGIMAHFQSKKPADSLGAMLNATNQGVVANVLALSNIQGLIMELPPDPDADTIVTPISAAGFNNYLINHREETDTVLVSKIVRLARRPSNVHFKNILLEAAANAYYSAGETGTAFRLMHEVAFLGQQPKNYNTIGLWMLEQGAPERATHFFEQAIYKNYLGSTFNRAFALFESNDMKRALPALDILIVSNDPQLSVPAEKLKSLIVNSPTDALRLSDEEKFEYSRHRFTLAEENEFVRFIGTISDERLRASAIVDRCKRWDEADEPEHVLATLALARDLRFSDKTLFEAGIHLKLRCIARAQQWPLLEKEMAPVSFEGIYRLEKIYFEALLAETNGKKEDAGRKYETLSKSNPYFEDAIVASAAYAAENSPDKLKGYTILVNALDLNPSSVKLLKAYFVQAARLDFDEPAKETLDKLHLLLSREAFVKFAEEYPDIFEVNRN